MSSYDYPVLRSLTIGRGGGLRGVSDLTLNFNYPLTVLTGQNGSGKSTLLSLAVLAFHAAPSHKPLNAIRVPKKSEDSTYYTFSDFFFRGWGDDPTTGVAVTWEYEDALGRKSVSFTRTSDRKWMKYERRPARPVHYLGISRAVPATERRALRVHFASPMITGGDHNLSHESRQQVGSILGRQYDEAAVLEVRGHAMRRLAAETRYSSFNMGAGEDCVVEMLDLLHRTPSGSLVVIEEIEMGLHPAAVHRLAPILIETCLKKSLQLVVSTHSPDFVDQVPREARVLLQRGPQGVRAAYNPSARHALSDLRGVAQAELFIACEDEFAARIIQAALPGDLLRRSRIGAIGSKDELSRFAEHHVLSQDRECVLMVWDGDVSDADIRRAARRLAANPGFPRLNWIRLPGDAPPETWATRRLTTEAGIRGLAATLNDSIEAVGGFMTELSGMADHHALGFRLAELSGRTRDDAEAAVVRTLLTTDPAAMGALRAAVESILDGANHREPAEPTVDE